MKKSLETFIDSMLKEASKMADAKSVLNYLGICSGAVMFVISAELLNYDDISTLWDDKYNEFQKLINAL